MTSTINGWPLIKSYGDPQLVRVKIPGTTRSLTLQEDVAPLLAHFVRQYHNRIRKIDKKGDVFDDWSYSEPREGNAAPGQWSDHSSGTAVDLNATKEGAQGPRNRDWWMKRSTRVRTLGQKRYKVMNRMIRKHEVLMWGGSTELGGSYSQPQNWDWMHVAVKRGTTKAQVRALVRRKKIGPDGRKVRRFKR